MLPKQNVMNNKIFRIIALIFLFGVASVEAVSAQDMRINKGCPKLGDPNIGKYTIDQLNCLCHNGAQCSQSPASQSPGQVTSAENGAALTCGQHKALAAFAKANTGFVEGQTSQSIVDKYCGGPTSNDQVPSSSQVGGNFLTGVFNFERGYYGSFSGRKRTICGSSYRGKAFVDKGKIEFNSGGHTWRGTIASNSFISITRDGVNPRPKNHTVISGPMTNADLYNGYCGGGYFRLLAGS